MEFTDETAVVTGGAQGIGHGIATALADHGSSVAIADIDRDGATDAAASIAGEHGVDTLGVECDMTDEDDVESMVETVCDELGTVTQFVNNAGASAGLERTWQMPAANWRSTVELCMTGTFLGTKHAVGRMLDEDVEGAVVNVSSLNYTAGAGGMSHYSAAKAGVSQFTEVVASETGDRGVRVNAVAPGATRTPTTEEGRVVKGTMREEFLERTPLGRIGEPEDVAPVVVFLLSEYAHWVTGETILVDGGAHTRGLHSYYDTMMEMFGAL